MPNLSKHRAESNFAGNLAYSQYWGPVVLVALATVIKVLLFDAIGYKTPFLLYFGAVIFAARYLGEKAAIFTTALAALVSVYFFLAPHNSFSVEPAAALQVALFVLECVLITGFSYALKKASVNVIENEKRFRAMIEKGSEGITLMNLDGQPVYCSASVKSITGYTAQEYMDMPLWELNHPDEVSDVKEAFFRLTGHPGNTIKIIHRLKHKKGYWIWIENTITNLLDEPAVGALVANFTDVTNRITVEQQTIDFINVATHELKTPLTTLKAYTQLLQVRLKNADDYVTTELAKKINAQVDKLIALGTDLLDVSKIKAGRLHIQKAGFDINEVIIQVAEALQYHTTKHQIKFEKPDHIIVIGDKQAISQVITNLLTNAIKYSPAGGEVHITSEVIDHAVTVNVRDEGIGIPKSEIDKIFDRLYRAKNMQESFQGLGLGLYISARIVEQHGGKMGVHSIENKGSTFWFSIPLN